MGAAADKLNKHVKSSAKARGLETRKPVWLDRVGAPDWLVFDPDRPVGRPRSCFIEIKSENDRDRPGQPEEQKCLTLAGFVVFRCSTTQEIDDAFSQVFGGAG